MKTLGPQGANRGACVTPIFEMPSISPSKRSHIRVHVCKCTAQPRAYNGIRSIQENTILLPTLHCMQWGHTIKRRMHSAWCPSSAKAPVYNMQIQSAGQGRTTAYRNCAHLGAWAYRRNLMFLTSGQKRNAVGYKRICLWGDVECHHEQRLHILHSAGCVHYIYMYHESTTSKVQLRSTEEICSSTSP